jgi:hypothetical protein
MSDTGYEWHYGHYGQATHARRRRDRGLDDVAQCGYSPGWFRSWLGTGNQAEYERATELPKCKNCLKLVRRG